MSLVSISKSLRIPKVSTQFAPNAESERFQDPRYSICPAWNHQDNLGREVSYFSFDSLTAGCNDPSQRITIENWLRPSYHPYLNAQGIEEDDISYSYASSFANHDTMNVRRDESFKQYGQYQLGGPVHPLDKPMSNAATAFEATRERERVARALQRKV